MNPRLPASIVLLVSVSVAMVSCDESSQAPPQPAAPVAAAIVVGAGFSYDPVGLPDLDRRVTTIRLGDRVRVFVAVPEWTPATFAMLDSEGRVLHSVRLDLPPGGTISGSLPQIDGWESIRVTRAFGALDSARFERRIGVPEHELTAERVAEIAAPSAKTGEESGRGGTSSSLATQESNLDPHFGRVIVLGGAGSTSSTASGVGDEWKQASPISDAHWLTDSVHQMIADAVAATFGR